MDHHATPAPPVLRKRYVGPYALGESEIFWSEHYTYLARQGYQLRDRYRPDWSPSWLGTETNPEDCEDSVIALKMNSMDATRQDGLCVRIKHVERGKNERKVVSYLKDTVESENYVPLVEFLQDPLLPDKDFMISLYLRPFYNPGLTNASHMVDFVMQTLQCLAFLHGKQVAHRNCCADNIMMDASSMYPMGHHPVRLECARDGVSEAVLTNCIRRPVRYYFVDFSRASRFREGELRPYARVREDLDKCLPEYKMAINGRLDTFKADVYRLGKLYQTTFLGAQYLRAGWPLASLQTLVTAMMHPQPEMRPTASRAIEIVQYVFREVNTTPYMVMWTTPQPPAIASPVGMWYTPLNASWPTTSSPSW
ncbi:predicted protein [Sparassis crispa]|uniref:Protein kinase domain-containing protein n=1 Tax=Sparassis crispa TaxID=139825 RepID=A0A401GYC6_9APHY|nr:predicted protein [Sparassis crispa]GBE86804.1 predicted protein [Sparassis crispa]